MPRPAVLLANLGSPASPSVPDVRRYLKEFLGDERVLDVSAPLRWALLEGIILRTRPKRSAHAYASVWTDKGSPLLVTSQSVRAKLAMRLGPATPVYLAMRYGSPSIADVLGQMAADGIDRALLMPQYPHYAMSSWETVVAKVYKEAARVAPGIRIDGILPFFADPQYIEVLHTCLAPLLAKSYDHLLFSYHGLPARHLRKADSSRAHCLQVPDCCATCSPVQATCYRAQCIATMNALARRANLEPGRYSMSFQSRLAGEPWLEPFTDYEFVRLAKSGVRKLLVICPSFVADCLETLEEISQTGCKTFLEAGGEQFAQVPCPNDSQEYIDFLASHMQKWLLLLQG